MLNVLAAVYTVDSYVQKHIEQLFENSKEFMGDCKKTELATIGVLYYLCKQVH